MENNKLIIFDFFGVISSEVSPFWLEEYFGKENAKQIKADIVGKADLGLINEQELYEELSRLSGVPASKIKEDWVKLTIIDNEMVEYIKQLKKCYKVILLSNAQADFLHAILKRHNLYPLFEEIIISGELGIKKPDKGIYEIALNKANYSAKDAYFIDDNPSNVAGAQSVGIDSVIYKNLTDLKEFINNIQ